MVRGRWPASRRPEPTAAAKQAADSGQVDLMPRRAGPGRRRKTPSLSQCGHAGRLCGHAAHRTDHLQRPAAYVSIPGTDLLYAANTSGNVFKSLTDQQNYILISGRWYRAPSLNGPWQFVPGNQVAARFCGHSRHQPQGKREGQRAGNAAGGGGAHRQQHPAKHRGGAHQRRCPPRRLTARRNWRRLKARRCITLSTAPRRSSKWIRNPGMPARTACGMPPPRPTARGRWRHPSRRSFTPFPPTSPLHYLTYVQVYGSTPGHSL